MKRNTIYTLLTTVMLLWIGSTSLFAQSPGGVGTTDVILWLRADAGVTTTVGNEITQWADQSGNNNNATPPNVSSRPTLNPSEINFLPTVDFDFGNRLDGTNLGLNGLTEHSFFAVYKHTQNVAGQFPDLFDFDGTIAFSRFEVFTVGGPGDSDGRIVYTDGNNGLVYSNLEMTIPRLISVVSTGGSSTAYLEGGGAQTGPASGLVANGNYSMGTVGQLDGDYAEFVFFDRPVNTSERERIETYLGLKYGFNVNHDYIASNGANLFNFAAYPNGRAGIARDDASGLETRKSRSQESDGVLIGAVGDIDTPGAITNDLSFFIWGHDGGSINTTTTTDITAGFVLERLEREWIVQSTNFTQEIDFQFDLDDAAPVVVDANVLLLIDEDGDGNFNTGTQRSQFVTSFDNTAKTVNFDDVTLNDGEVFTLVTRIVSPGAVLGSKFWLKANTGGAAWTDQSGNDVSVTPIGSPVVSSNLLNFNDAVSFDGTSQYYNLGSDLGFDGPGGATDHTIYAVIIDEKTSGFGGILGAQNNNSSEPQFLTQGGNPRSIYFDANGPAGPRNSNASVPLNTPTIVSATIASDTNLDYYFNGTADASFTNFPNVFGGNNVRLGASHLSGNPTFFYDGNMAEIIVYEQSTAADRTKIESYLAIKYGITLNNGATNYLASDGTTQVWAVDPTYTNDIFGIARDDVQGLNQEISKSVNDGAVLTVSTSTDFTTANDGSRTDLFDQQFLLIANDGGSTTATTAVGVPAALEARLERQWKVKNTGLVNNGGTGVINLSFDIDASPLRNYLLIRDGIALTGITPTINGGKVEFANVGLIDGAVFSLGFTQIAPGDVVPGIALWLKADEGATAAQWDDQSGSGLDATGSNNPVLTADALNFNPAFTFNGTDQNFTGPAGNTALNSDDVTSFTVYINDDVSGSFTSPFTNRFSNTAGAPDAEGITFYNNGSGREFWTGTGAGSTWNIQSAGNVMEGVAEILGLTTTGGVGAVQNIYVNGASAGTGTGTGTHIKQTDGFYPYRVGSGDNFGGTTFFFDGRIAEQIVYASVLDATSRQKIESYLAIKYGMTLNAGNTAYLASDGTTTVWPVDATYNSDIFGIANDAAQGLDQQISKSVNTGAVLTLSTDTNFTGANGTHTSLTDGQFLVVGNDGGSTTTTTATGVPATLDARHERQWKAANTASVGAVNLSFDINANNLRTYELIINGAASGISGTINGTMVEFTGVTFTTGDIFSVGFTQIAPGDVVPGLALWLKADVDVTGGATVTAWDDQSGVSNNASASGGAEPDATVNTINFNTSLTFDGTSFFDLSASLGSGNQSYSFFAVANRSSSSGGTILSQGDLGVNNSDLRFQMGTNTVDNWVSNLLTTPAPPDNISGMMSSIYNNTSGREIRTNGGTLATNASTLLNLDDGIPEIGRTVSTGSGNFNGDIAEVIFYNNTVDATQRQQIESYLAIKYGITLNSGTTAYLASDGTTTVWPVDATYNSDIFGIANDAAQGLDQQISKSVNTGAVLTLSTDTNFTGANGTHISLTDGQFLVVGNDGGSTTTTTATGVPATLEARHERQWRAENTGSVGAVNLSFDINANNLRTYELIINGAASGISGAINGTTVEFTGVTFTTGDIFSVGFTQVAPGDVVPNLVLWLKANDGVTGSSPVTGWTDASGNDTVTINGVPDAITNAVNFNPTVEFLTGASVATLTNGFSATDAIVYGVVRPRANGSFRTLVQGPVFNTMATIEGGSDNFGSWDGALRDSGIDIPEGSIALIQIDNNGGTEQSYRSQSVPFGPIATTVSDVQTFIGNSSTGQPFGEVAEVIAYSTASHTPLQQQQIESYLAIKYGITLNSGGTAYVDSAGNTVWPVDATYISDIFGIANDVDQALDQQISKSVNTGAVLTLSTDTNFTTANGTHVSLTDGQFLVIGNDGASGAPGDAVNTDLETTTYYERSAREWKAVNTGTVGAINLQFDGYDDTWLLLTRTVDGDFSATTGTTATPLSATGTVATTLTGTTFFTLARLATSIEFEAATASADENAAVSNLPRLLIDGTLNADTDIDVTIAAGATAATLGTDYTFGGNTAALPQTITVTVPAGTYTSGTPVEWTSLTLSGGGAITFAITGDAIVEADETIDLTLSNPQPGLVVQNIIGGALIDNHVYTITNDDTATVTIAADTDADETTASRVFTLTMSTAVSTDVDVSYALTGTAADPADYDDATTVVGTVTITAGTTTETIDLTVVNDTEVEVTETVIATLTAATNNTSVTADTTPETLNITDDDAAALTISIVQTTDGAESGTPTNAQFTVSLDGGVTNNTGAAITGTITLTGTATAGSDYTNVTSFSIADGDSSVVVDIPVLDDSEVEVTETVIATISAPSVGAVSATDNATANITDDDATALTISIAQTTDGAESGTPTNAQFTVSLDGGVTNNTGAAITGTITLTGTATAGSDYTNVTTFSIADGDSSVVVDIPVLDDTEVEVTETVIATISAPSVGAVSATDNATANITDDDATALTISIAQTTDGAESGTPTDAQFTVSLDGGVTNNTGSAITGTLALTGTATAGSDYTNVTTFSIADGDSSVVVDIPVLNDTEVEVTETVIATISAPSVGAVSATDNATANITDDDATALTISIAQTTDGAESGTPTNAQFTVSLDGGVTNNTGATITGTLALTGTATAGSDYTNVTTFSIADGDSSVVVDIPVLNDTEVEVTETVIATISAPNVGAVSATDNATANITDDDLAALTISIGTPVDGTEGTSNITYTVSLDGGVTNETGSAITGTVTLTGTATNGTDYTNVTTFSIADGANSGTITVTVTDDTDVEVNETVIATISAPSIGAIGTAAATANIIDDDGAALTISIGSPVDGTEGGANVSYTVSLDGGATNTTGSAITGTVTLTGTATNGTDYINVTTFSIANTASSGTITVPVTDDSIVEVSETVIATISAPNVGAVSATDNATANILDNDTAGLTISIGSPVDGTEGGANVSYTVSLDGGLSNGTGAAITGTVALTGTATNGTDYTNVTTFSIADGDSSVVVDIPVLDDTEVEVTETVIATISAPSVGTINTASATANITDDDAAALTISIGSPVDGTEGTSNVSYTVSLDGGVTNETGAAITGTVALTGTATNGLDYTNVTTFSIADGASSGTITVTVTDDTDVEVNETVIATISAPNVGAVSATDNATANIIDDDSASLTISIGSPVDGTEGGANVSYTVSLDGGVTNTTGSAITGTVTLTGTATNGTDYTNVTTFSIADGASSGTITVTVTDDSDVEVTETVIATISAPNVGAVSATDNATANILDNDAAALTISIGSPIDGTEGASNISYTVSLDGGLSNGTGSAITGTVALTGTATNGSDYTNVTTFSIADGASSGTITVTVTDDTDVEVNETVIATISAPSVGAVSATDNATANIIDDDSASLTISIGSPVDGTEGGANVSYTVSLDGGATNTTGSAITGTVTLTGTATNSTDYTNVTTFSIADGASSGTITVTVTDDSDVEVNETVIATISAPNVGAVSATDNATANILDNDAAALTISIGSPVDGTEGGANVSYTVSLDGGLSNGTGAAITGTVALTGTATNGSDYTNVTTFSIADGASSGTITVPVTDDTDVEVTETVIATISAPSVGTINTAAATANINDDDSAALTISIGSPVDGTEGGAAISYTVSLDGGVTNTTGAAITGTVALTGTATNGSDYTDVTTFSIADGASSTTIIVTVTDDTEVEVTETVIATISAPNVGAVSATNSSTANIIDDDDISVTATGTMISAADGAAVANGIETETITVQLKDAVGNDLTGAGINVTFAVTGSAVLSSTTAVTDANGTATITITSAVAETVDVTATIDDDNDGGTTAEVAILNGSPAQVLFTSDAPDPTNANTTIIATGPVPANGTDVSTVTVQLADSNGNLLTTGGETVALNVSGNAVLVSGVTDNGDGTYTATYSNLLVESVTITGTLNGAAISNNATISFILDTDPNCTVNCDTDSDGDCDLNCDTDGDGDCDLNCDTDGDGDCDLNCDTDGDGDCDINCDTDGDGDCDLNCDTDGDGDCDLNCDTDGDGDCDVNCDTDGDGDCDLNCDTDGDGDCDVNCDTDGDGDCDVNCDTDGDGDCDLNCDTDGDGDCDLNCDTDGDGDCDLNCDTDGDGDCDLNCDTDGDGVCDVNCDTFGSLEINQGFSPNGDGVNDTWIIGGIESFPNHEVKLFNRWGIEVFSAINYQNDWNGVSTGKRVLGGSRDRLPTGAYYYVIETGTTEVAPFTGWIYINY
ncbi:Calx-beta domain-containing protein [Aquimarina sp. 2304DJ70-9]|uniref:Calx-beta domain-containing protein n=1 Tax=Aquimarina penaris TaxID=3231044 RepID=UPI003462D178